MPMHVEMLHQVHRGCRHCSIESGKVYHAPNVEENSSPEKVGHRQKIVPSTMTGVSGNSPKPLQKRRKREEKLKVKCRQQVRC